MKRLPVGVLVLFFISLHCSGRFVKRDELTYLSKKYSGVYSIRKPVEFSHNQKLDPGMKVRLYFKADGESLKVYAYPANAMREEALGKNVLHLFKEDFRTEEYRRAEFEQKLSAIVF